MHIRLDEHFPHHPKVAGLSAAAFRLHVTAMCACMAELTDGQVPSRLLSGQAKTTRALVSAGLWERDATGFRIHDWAKWQLSVEQLQQLRKANAERQARHRDRKLRHQQSRRDISAHEPGSNSVT